MKEQLVSIETARLLNEKGFNGNSFYHYYKDRGECPIFENSLHLSISCEGGLHTDEHLLSQQQLEEYSGSSGYILAPTQAMAQKWIRENFKLHITIYSRSQESWMYRITRPGQSLEVGVYAEDFLSYEETLEDALKYCLSIV